MKAKLVEILRNHVSERWDFRFVRIKKNSTPMLWSENKQAFIGHIRFVAENIPPITTIRKAADVSDDPFDMTHVTEMKILNRRIWKELKKSLPEG